MCVHMYICVCVCENLPRNIVSILLWDVFLDQMNLARKSINSFIKPLVDELLELWHGVQIKLNLVLCLVLHLSDAC